MSNWKKLIQEEMMEQEGETFEDVVECTLNDEELVVEFDDGVWGSFFH